VAQLQFRPRGAKSCKSAFFSDVRPGFIPIHLSKTRADTADSGCAVKTTDGEVLESIGDLSRNCAFIEMQGHFLIKIILWASERTDTYAQFNLECRD
jgi:hypothetical protein